MHPISEIRPPLTPEETQNINLPSGLSLREYLTGQALAGILSNYQHNKPEVVAFEVVDFVDALIIELNRTKQ